MAPTSPNDFAAERRYVDNFYQTQNNNAYFDAGYKNCLLRTLRFVRRYPNLNYIIKRLEEEKELF